MTVRNLEVGVKNKIARSSSDPWAGSFCPEPVLRTRVFRFWSDRADLANGKRSKNTKPGQIEKIIAQPKKSFQDSECIFLNLKKDLHDLEDNVRLVYN